MKVMGSTGKILKKYMDFPGDHQESTGKGLTEYMVTKGTVLKSTGKITGNYQKPFSKYCKVLEKYRESTMKEYGKSTG